MKLTSEECIRVHKIFSAEYKGKNYFACEICGVFTDDRKVLEPKWQDVPGNEESL